MNKIIITALALFALISIMSSCHTIEEIKNPQTEVSLNVKAENITTNSAKLIGSANNISIIGFTYGFYITTDANSRPNRAEAEKSTVDGNNGYYLCSNGVEINITGLNESTTYYYYFWMYRQYYDGFLLSEQNSFTTLQTLTTAIEGLWVEDENFTSSSNTSFEFKPYGTFIQRQFIGDNEVITVNKYGSYETYGDKQIAIRTDEAKIYTVTSIEDDKLDIIDIQGNRYVMKKVDISISAKYAQSVDLGLPSGTLWADRNLGAFTPEENGNKYSWGETYEKEEYQPTVSDYYRVNLGTNINSSKYDAAYNISEKWEMPTAEQVNELIEYCTCSEGNIIGPNGNSIYLGGIDLWTATSYVHNTDAKTLSADWNYTEHIFFVEIAIRQRGNGYYIRPVYKK